MDAKAVVGIILGLILIISVAMTITSDQVSSITNLVTVTNETITVSYNGYVSLGHEPMVNGSETVYNTTVGTTLTYGTPGIGNYTLDVRDATINISDETLDGLELNVTYDYQPAGYVEGVSTRAVLAILVLFLAIGGLVLIARDSGVM